MVRLKDFPTKGTECFLSFYQVKLSGSILLIRASYYLALFKFVVDQTVHDASALKRRRCRRHLSTEGTGGRRT